MVQDLVDEGCIKKPIDGNHGGIHPKGSDFVNAGIPFIMASDIVESQIDLTSCKFITEEQASRLQKGHSFPGDVLLTHKATLGRTAIVPDLTTRFIMLTPQVTYYRVTDESKVDRRFLKYFFDSPRFQTCLVNHGDAGSTRSYIGITAQRALPICLPSNHEQRAIGDLLSSLDDKIDLLHRQNATLEALAETLFRQYFIEEAQDDWEEGELGDILTVKGGTTPSTKNETFWDGDIHWTSPRDLSGNDSLFLLDTARKITAEGLAQISSGLLPVGSLLMSSRAPVGYLAFSTNPVAINQGYIGILDDKGFSREFIFLWLKTHMEYVKGHANGSTFQEISKSTFKKLEILKPPGKLRLEFQSFITPIFEKLLENTLQIQTLEKLRDALLPRLMSGAIRIDFGT